MGSVLMASSVVCPSCSRASTAFFCECGKDLRPLFGAGGAPPASSAPLPTAALEAGRRKCPNCGFHAFATDGACQCGWSFVSNRMSSGGTSSVSSDYIMSRDGAAEQMLAHNNRQLMWFVLRVLGSLIIMAAKPWFGVIALVAATIRFLMTRNSIE